MMPAAAPVPPVRAGSSRWWRASCVALVSMLGLLGVQAASAPPYARSEGSCTVRAGTARANDLPIAQRDAHGIPPGDDVAVLNVIVQHPGPDGLVNERA